MEFSKKLETEEELKEALACYKGSGTETLPIVRTLLLLFIQKNPDTSGYYLMTKIAEFTREFIDLKSGTTYSELRKMEEARFVTSIQEAKGRKTRKYLITKEGTEELQKNINLIKLRINFILLPILDLFEKE